MGPEHSKDSLLSSARERARGAHHRHGVQRLERSKRNASDELHRTMLQDLIDDRIWNRLIRFDDRDSHQRRCRAASVVWFLAPQCEVRDVDSASTEQTAEKAD